MSEKPSYLKLLNAVSLAETRAHQYLKAWADTTPNPDVRRVLLTVAWREGEHGMAFAKRINELGYELREKDDPKFAKQMELATSDCSDLEKFEKLGYKPGRTVEDPDVFDDFFKDHTIDIQTAAMLGRYIAEERSSGCMLQECYEQLRAAAPSKVTNLRRNGNGNGASSGASSDTGGDAITSVVGKLDDVIGAIDKLARAVAKATRQQFEQS